jgi:hypothetical protein
MNNFMNPANPLSPVSPLNPIYHMDDEEDYQEQETETVVVVKDDAEPCREGCFSQGEAFLGLWFIVCIAFLIFFLRTKY